MRFEPAERAHLHSIVQAFGYPDERTISAFATQYELPDPEDDESATAPAVATLSNLLYGQLYCRGRVQPLPIAARGSSGMATSSFVTDIFAANQLPAAWQSGWTQQADPTGDARPGAGDGAGDGAADFVQLKRSGITLTAERSDVKLIGDDDEALLRCPTADLHASPGFLYFSNTAIQPMSTEAMIRFYWHLTPSIGPLFMSTITTLFADIGFQAKLLQSEDSYQRCDAGVLYLDAPSLDLDRVVRVHHALIGGLRQLRPAFTLDLAHGLGAAAEPASHESFGQRICRALAEGFVSLGPGRQNQDALVQAMTNAVAAIEPTQTAMHGLDDDLVAKLQNATWAQPRCGLGAQPPPTSASTESSVAATIERCLDRLQSSAVQTSAGPRWVTGGRDDHIVRLSGPGFAEGNDGISAFLRRASHTSAAYGSCPQGSRDCNDTLGLNDGLARRVLRDLNAGSHDLSEQTAQLRRRALRSTHRNLGAGWWSGRSGIAWALATAASSSGDQAAGEAAATLVRGIVREWRNDDGWVSHRHDPRGTKLGRGVALDALGLAEGPCGIALALLATRELLPLDVALDIDDAVEEATTQALTELRGMVADPASALGLFDGLAGLALGIQLLAGVGVGAAQGSADVVRHAWHQVHAGVVAESLRGNPTLAVGLAGVGLGALVTQDITGSNSDCLAGNGVPEALLVLALG